MSVVELEYYHVLWLDTATLRIVGAARLRHKPKVNEPVRPIVPTEKKVRLKPLPCPPSGHIVVLVCTPPPRKKKKKQPKWDYCVPLSWIRGRVSRQWRPSYPSHPNSTSLSSTTSNNPDTCSERKSSGGS